MSKKLELVIDWTTYKEKSWTNSDNSEEAPSWFNKYQMDALDTIVNHMFVNKYIFPHNATELADLKDEFIDDVKRAIVCQIDYVKDVYAGISRNPIEEIRSASINRLAEGPIDPITIQHFLDALAPSTKKILLRLGWLYKGVSRRLNRDYFYKNLIGE